MSKADKQRADQAVVEVTNGGTDAAKNTSDVEKHGEAEVEMCV